MKDAATDQPRTGGGLLTPDQVAQMLTISTKTLHAHVKAGEIAYISIGGGQKRIRMAFDLKDILAFIERRKTRKSPITMPEPPASKGRSTSTVVRLEDRQRPPARKKHRP